MNDFDQQLRQLLRDVGRPSADQSEALRKEMVHMYEDKLKKVERYARNWIWITAAVCGVGGVLIGLGAAKSTTLVILGAAAFIVAIELQTLVKLWYWQMNTKLSLLKEMKELRLQLAERQEKEPPDA